MPPGEYVELAVTDTGFGMDAETLAHVFEPFFTTKEVGKGTGLGLSSVYGVVKQSGGWIWGRSEPGEGATFLIYFPPAGAAPGSAGPAEREEAAHARATVLVAEDEASVRLLVRKVLERAGYEVVEAANGEEALRIVRTRAGPIDLLLTDVVMPRMNGRMLTEKALELRPGMRVVFMSGYAGETLVERGSVDGAHPFLAKPLVPALLVERVRDELARAG